MLVKTTYWQEVIVLVFIALLTACNPSIPADIRVEMAKLPVDLDYNLHVKPILSDRCFACHGNDKANQEAKLRLDIAENAYGELPENPGKYAIVPKNIEKSQVFHRLISEDTETVMPPTESNLVLSPYEKAVLIKWIELGAVYKPHWAFIKAQKNNPPKVKNTAAIQNPIDNFVLAKLAEQGWSPNPKADKETLLRRVSLDLTGLPPSIEEMNAFLKDESQNAYEKVVDRLLNSLHYGEQMATDWMDVARFADTHGYTVDRYRDMSPWRDWVIKAFNKNMPYDQFIIWQLAGDLLPNATKEQILATGFNRNHQQNMEGGIIPEEFRVEYVADRTNTLGTAFLGLTMECARCHDHKYDPISQKEYYQLFSFFNNIKEAGQISYDNAAPAPTLLLTNEALDKTIDFINKKISQSEDKLALLNKQISNNFQKWLKTERLRTSVKNRLPKGLLAHYDFEDKTLSNRLASKHKAKLAQVGAYNLKPQLVDAKKGKGLLLDGDAWLDCQPFGVFDRTMPFSIGLWINLPKDLKDGVIFHKGEGAALYNFKGFHLALKDNHLELLMAHNAPYNAIIKYAKNPPRNEWIHLMMTYDGSAKAKGLKIYLNGQVQETIIDQDKLYKTILLNRKKEPGLQIGARMRGIGIKGAIIDEVVIFEKELAALEVQQITDNVSIAQLFKKPSKNLSTKEIEKLKIWYNHNKIPSFQQALKTLQKNRKTLSNTQDTIQEVMVMQEMDKPRPTFILDRGQYNVYGEAVKPATPLNILPFPDDYPKNRLGLAKWLVHPDNPLTTRVLINRLWQQFFGTGFVKTTEDFGFQGSLPSHPKLLDWLAVEFSASGWDMKAIIKKIVLSNTYQQSSKVNPQILEKDKANIWLSRGPSVRLSAEQLRDNALAASDLLVKKIGGKSVKPHQPRGLWKVNGGAYIPDTGENLYRRGLYTFWKRSVPNPTQSTFDAPTRSNCSVKRQKTSTPLQALILLNDPTFVEAAVAIGAQISQTTELSEGIQNAFRKLTGRKASKEELNVLMDLQKAEYQKFKANPEKAAGWIVLEKELLPTQISTELLAANTVLASTILNADATVVKR